MSDEMHLGINSKIECSIFPVQFTRHDSIDEKAQCGSYSKECCYAK